MRAFALLSLLSLAVALPASINAIEEGGVLSVVEREVATVAVRVPVEQVSQEAPVLTARALFDGTREWPTTTTSVTTVAFQVDVTNLKNGKYRLNWNNSDAANARRKIKLTVNSSSGARLYDVVTSTRTRGSVELSKSGSNFRIILDQE